MPTRCSSAVTTLATTELHLAATAYAHTTVKSSVAGSVRIDHTDHSTSRTLCSTWWSCGEILFHYSSTRSWPSGRAQQKETHCHDRHDHGQHAEHRRRPSRRDDPRQAREARQPEKLDEYRPPAFGDDRRTAPHLAHRCQQDPDDRMRHRTHLGGASGSSDLSTGRGKSARGRSRATRSGTTSHSRRGSTGFPPARRVTPKCLTTATCVT